MDDRIWFYLDEHIPKAVADGLRQRGVDVLRAQEAGMRQAKDEEHLELAKRQGRVIVTRDSDFLNLDHQGVSHSGIVYIGKQISIGEMISSIALIYEAMSRDEMLNHIEYW